MVTHRTTRPPVQCLISAEQTGRDISIDLWSYVEERRGSLLYNSKMKVTSTETCISGTYKRGIEWLTLCFGCVNSILYISETLTDVKCIF